jgi:hypothetical protein
MVAQGMGMWSMANGLMLGCSREMVGWTEPNSHSGHLQGEGKQPARPGGVSTHGQ